MLKSKNVYNELKNLVIYDSQFGNTEKIAQTIAKSIFGKAVRVADVDNTDLKDLDLLVIGSPTLGGRATVPLQKFLEQIPKGILNGVKVATFDTRFSEKDVNFALRLLLKTIDYAAPKMIKILIDKGGKQITKPRGFIVKGKEGPLISGELEKASVWIKE